MIKVILCVLVGCLVAPAFSAPTEDISSTTTTTTASPTPASQSEARATAGGLNRIDAHAHLANSSFTCVGRAIGYYADVSTNCKVYHFCLLGEYNSEPMYQRLSYLCLNETTFDQQALDCFEDSKLTTPCSEAHKFYETSNAALREAVIGKASTESGKKEDQPKTSEKEAEKREEKKEEKKEEEKKEGEHKDEEKKEQAEKKDEDKKDD